MLGLTAITGEIDRLIINLAPRSAKSTTVSVALPAFLLGRDPTKRIIVVSFNQDLAAQFSRQTRQVMQSDWYRALFPSTRIPTRAGESQFFTSAGGFRMATSTGGTFTGRGGDLIIIDDPLKAEDTYSESARSAAYDWATTTLFKVAASARRERPKAGRGRSGPGAGIRKNARRRPAPRKRGAAAT